MNTDDALVVAATAKQLFPFTTDMQAAAVCEIAERVPEWPRRDEYDVGPAFFLSTVLRSMAEQDERISLPKLKAAVDTELRRRGLTTADERLAQQRREESRVQANWSKIDSFIRDCSDQDLADLKSQALLLLENQKARDMFRDKPVRESKTLRWLVYRIATGQADERGAA